MCPATLITQNPRNVGCSNRTPALTVEEDEQPLLYTTRLSATSDMC